LKAIVLAGGYAKRLWPLTKDTPKPLLPVGGKPIIEYMMDKLIRIGIEHIIISTNLTFENKFREWLQSTDYKDVEIIAERSRSEEDKPGAVKALVEISKEIHTDCLVIAGDNLFTVDFDGIMKFYRDKSLPVVGLYDLETPDMAKQYATVLLDQDDKIINFEEKPVSPKTTLVATCLYIFPERVLPRLEEYDKKDLGKDQPGRFIEWLYQQEPVYGYIVGGDWFDIGTPELYDEADDFFSN
jgi:glucose-1-phosphate thymidylyltransferase